MRIDKSGNLPAVGTGANGSGSRVIDCAITYES